jgi:hypothetical protein
MVATAYLDESGTHGKRSHSPAVTVAAIIGTATGWAGYERDAKSLFDEHGVKRFHAKKLRAWKGEFVEWDTDKRTSFTMRLMGLMEAHLERGICVCLNPIEYETIYRTSKIPKRIRKDSEYALCFRVCLWLMVHYMRGRQNEWPVTVVLEQGHRNAPDAERVFYEVNREVTQRFGSVLGAIAFETKERCIPLSAPDSFAHIAYRIAAGTTKSQGTVLPPEHSGMRFQRYTLTKESLQQLTDMLHQGQSIPDRITWTGFSSQPA